MTAQNFDKILLGKLKGNAGTGVADGENIWLEKHNWSCGWYWGFGYLGNKNCHFHFNSLLHIKDGKGSVKYCASDLFESTKISDKEWWVIRDLFVQAYALQKAAEVYQYGGHQATKPGLTDIIKNQERADQINADLAKVLDTAWDYACKAVNKQIEVAA
jgi:hypothetical protein